MRKVGDLGEKPMIMACSAFDSTNADRQVEAVYGRDPGERGVEAALQAMGRSLQQKQYKVEGNQSPTTGPTSRVWESPQGYHVELQESIDGKRAFSISITSPCFYNAADGE